MRGERLRHLFAVRVLIEVRRPHGDLVRDPCARPTRTQHPDTDDSPAGPHGATSKNPPTTAPNATADQAELLAIPPGEPLLTRETLQDSHGIRRYHRLYMPFSVAEHTPWADDPHLPSAPTVHAHFTEQEPALTRVEHVRARTPIGDEHHTLAIPAGTPLLITLRITSHQEHPITLEGTRQRADQIELAYTLP